MKFIQFPSLYLTSQANQQLSGIIYNNNTNSYILIMGLSDIFITLPQNTTLPFFAFVGIVIVDSNGVQIDSLIFDFVTSMTEPGSFPYWNGTTVESGSGSVPLVQTRHVNVSQKRLIPPQSQIQLVGNSSVSGIPFNFDGGWGLILDNINSEEIVQEKIKL